MVIVDVSICHDRDFIYTSIPKLILEIEYWPSKNIEKTKQKKRQSFSKKKKILMKFRGSNIIVILLAS